MNLDFAAMTELAARQGMSIFTDIPALWDEVQHYMDGSGINYYQAGVSAGKIVKMLFDLNINN